MGTLNFGDEDLEYRHYDQSTMLLFNCFLFAFEKSRMIFQYIFNWFRLYDTSVSQARNIWCQASRVKCIYFLLQSI